jgi:DNA-binding MarR family transcriptional regulator
MASDGRIREIQRLYPLLYFAAHRDHTRADGLSESELRLLHHIEADPGTFAAALGRHLGLSRSRLSEALEALERKGLIDRERDTDGRKRISLTARGRAAITSSDGLDSATIGAILDQLDDADQERVLEAFRLIARSIRRRQQ